jgi:hypothetical protein
MASDRLGAASISLNIVSQETGSNVGISTYSGVIACTRGSANAADPAIALKLTMATDCFNFLAYSPVVSTRRADLFANASQARSYTFSQSYGHRLRAT